MKNSFHVFPAILASALFLSSSACAEPQWKVIDPGIRTTLRSVSFADKNNAWAVGDSGTVLHSKDAGCSWESVMTPSDGTLRGVHALDKDHVYIVGDGDSDAPAVRSGHVLLGKPLKAGTLLVTGDGGTKWDRVFIAMNFELRAVWMASQNVGQICNHGGSDHPDGDSVVTTTGLRGWRQDRVFRGLNSCFWLDEQTAWAVGTRVSVGFFPAPTSPLYTHKTARIVSSVDGGKTWNPVDAPAGGDLRCIRFADKNVGVAVGDAGAILRTTDAGKTWAAVDPGVKQNFRGVAFAEAKRGWIVGSGGCILETADGGATWKAVASPTPKDLSSVCTSADGKSVVAVGVDGTLLRLQ